MKPILTTLLLVATLSAGAQTAATKPGTDSIIMSYMNLQGATAATAKQTYTGVTQAQVAAIIAGVTQYVQTQLATLPWLAPTTVFKYAGSKPLSYSNKSNFTISGDSITAGNGPGIYLNGCSSVIIHHCKIINGTSVNGAGVAIHLVNCQNVSIDSVLTISVSSGVFAESCTNTVVNLCQFQNCVGVYPRGQGVQLSGCIGGTITNNRVDNMPGASSNPEDMISIYKSNGLSATQPILVSGNWLRGYSVSKSGSAIMSGDFGGQYQLITNNICVNSGNVGIGCAGGNNITISNNEIFGSATPVSNCGLYAAALNGVSCSMITVTGNKVTWVNKSGQNNPTWFPTPSQGQSCGTISGVSGNNWNAGLTAAILPAVIITYK